MAGDNPILDGYAAIWSMLEANSDFATTFPTGTVHQVRYDTSLDYAPDPDMDELAPADYPQCRVVMVSAAPGTERDSSNSFLDVQYAIEVCSGSQHQTVLMNACWAIYRAMLEWREYVRDSVTWNSTSCVYDVDARELNLTDKNEDRNRGTQQWITVWTTVVRFCFATADLTDSGT